MLSKEVEEIIKMLRASKEQNRGKETTAESALADRKRIDEIMSSFPTPQGISIEVIDEQDVKGEYLRHKDIILKKSHEHILLFLHGGGFMNGSVLSRCQLCSSIMKCFPIVLRHIAG